MPSGDSARDIKPGDKILIRDAFDNELPGTAASRPEPGKDFVVIWVRFDGDGETDAPMPWPEHAVHLDPGGSR